MSLELLNSIISTKKLRELSEDNLPQLAKELREFIIDVVATKEGHLGASLCSCERGGSSNAFSCWPMRCTVSDKLFEGSCGQYSTNNNTTQTFFRAVESEPSRP